jgi:hypothetical protein
MSKKILLALATIVVVAGGVAAMSAWEAHVINVTAHIENALYVHPDKIDFGTVFPQEYLEKEFTIELSQSFKEQNLEDPKLRPDLDYKIVQKLKPIWPKPAECTQNYTTIEEARLYCHDATLPDPCCYLDLCPFLSKEDADPDDFNDYGVPSYYVVDAGGDFCRTPSPDYASGYLHIENDPIDLWKVDLKVPPVAGYVGQDWPETCLPWVVPQDSEDYGCDLWVEVTAIPAKY